jgi:hypothetical protein
MLEGGEQGRDGAARDHGAGGIMHQHNIRRLGSNRLKPRAHAIFPRGAASHHGQARQAL